MESYKMEDLNLRLPGSVPDIKTLVDAGQMASNSHDRVG